MLNHRAQLLEIYAAGLAAVQGEQAVYKALVRAGQREPCYVLAIGKAAKAMFQGAQRYYAEQLLGALIITKHGHSSEELTQLPHVEVLEAAHPLPDETSLQAGQRLIEWLQALPAQARLLCLISGGTSSLVEVLADDWTLDKLQAKTSAMLANGASIIEINTERKRLSRIKGGRLWDFIGQRPVTCLLISDVPGDDPAVIGSGLLFPFPEDAVFHFSIVASNQTCLQAMQQAAEQQQLPVTLMPDLLEGNAVTVAEQCIEFLRQSAPGVYLWGAETTVVLPANPGRGGRNQHLALAAALHIQPDEAIMLLAAGTDGTDGVTEDTGALVDNQTLARGKWENLDPVTCLAQADAGTFLHASADLIYTGPTGTNVMDVIVGLKG